MTTYRYAEMTWSACREAAHSGPGGSIARGHL